MLILTGFRMSVVVVCALAIAVTGSGSGGSEIGRAAGGKLALSVQHGDGDAPSDIYVVRTDGRWLMTKKTRLNEWGAAWSPDGRHIAFEGTAGYGAAGQIYTMNPDGTHRRRLTRPTNACMFSFLGQWSPDGRRIVYSCGDGDTDEIYVMKGDGTDKRRLTRSHGTDDFEPRWSRNGTHIVFTRDRSTTYDVYVVYASGGGERRLTRTGDSVAEAWTPGSEIVFTRSVVGNDAGPASGIYIMNAKGTGVRRLKPTDGYEIAVGGWSPDFKLILFAARRGISTVRPSDRFVRRLTFSDHDSDPTWAPGGRQIAFTRTFAREKGLWLVNRDGSGARRIVAATGIDDYYEPAWAPHP